MKLESTKTVHLGPGEGAGTVWMLGAELVTRKVSAEQTGGAYSLFEIEVGPRGGGPPHIQHREDECLFVLSVTGGFAIIVVGLASATRPHSGSWTRSPTRSRSCCTPSAP